MIEDAEYNWLDDIEFACIEFHLFHESEDQVIRSSYIRLRCFVDYALSSGTKVSEQVLEPFAKFCGHRVFIRGWRWLWKKSVNVRAKFQRVQVAILVSPTDLGGTVWLC